MNYNECFEELKKRSKDGYFWLEFAKRHYKDGDTAIIIKAYLNGAWHHGQDTYAAVITEIDEMMGAEPIPPEDDSISQADLDKWEEAKEE